MAYFEWTRRLTEYFGEVHFPIANVRLRRGDGGLEGFAIPLDSGAVISLLRRSVADVLGLNWENGRRVELGGIAGQRFRAHVHQVETVLHDSFRFPVPYAIADREDVPNLLGRLGFFDQVQIDFDSTLLATKVSRQWLGDADRVIWRFMFDLSRQIEARWDQLPAAPIVREAIVHFYNHTSSLFACIAGLIKLHCTHDLPVLLRSLFESSVQFEYMMNDVETRAPRFVAFGKVIKRKQYDEAMRQPRGKIAEHLFASENREQGEARINEEYDAAIGLFRPGEKRWYEMSFERLARETGREIEYRLWYRRFSDWVHSTPFKASVPQSWNPETLLQLAYHYLARVLLGIADYGSMILTSEQHEVLRGYAENFA